MIGTASSRISSHARTQWLAGAAARSAAASVVLPAPGSPETATRLRICISVARNSDASVDKRVASDEVGQRDVADDVATQGGRQLIAHRWDRRREPCGAVEHRACTIGCFALSWRSVAASSRSTI